MKFVYGLMLAMSVNAFAAYDNTWNVSHFWSGEYPNGFSVTVPGTIVMGRLAADPLLKRNVTCEMPYLAAIHPWNENRARKNKITFIGFTKIVELTMKEDYKLVSDEKSIELKRGDKIEYIQNYSEGAFAVRVNGEQYDADQELYSHVEPVDETQFAEDNWLLMTCANGKRAYIFFTDLFTETKDGTQWVEGINRTGPGMFDYGRVRDLTAKEARELEKERVN